MSSGSALVKSVLSGDTVILVNPSSPDMEKTLSLASCQAPRLARKDTKDEPFAFAAREFLRKKCVGQRVNFRVDYKTSTGRECGTITLNGENVAESLIAAGLAKVNPPRSEADPNRSRDLEALVAAEQRAISAEAGLHTRAEGARAAAVRDLQTPDNATSIFDSLKSKPVQAVVEAVRDGTTIRVLLPFKSSHALVNVHFSGVQSPVFKRAAAGASSAEGAAEGETVPTSTPEIVAEPFAKDAKHFTESRLLNRDVTLSLEGVDKYGNLFGTVVSSKDGRAFSEELLVNGLAKIAEWSLAKTPFASKLRAAEKVAKEKKVRVFKDYEAPASSVAPGTARAFTGKVVEVPTADTVVILEDGTGAERRVGLASIRAPRMGNAKRGEKPEAWAWEAKDTLRSLAIGKNVRVTVDYARSVSKGEGVEAESRHFCTVVAEGKNLAERLVSEGLATVVRHRAEEERASDYDALVAAEQNAQRNQRGLHSKKEAPIRNINDVAGAAKAKTLLPLLRLAGAARLKGIIEFVLAPGRFRVFIPRESCVITFAIQGIQAPSMGGRDGAKPQPFAAEALKYTRHSCLQREVELVVDRVDKTGTFVGLLYAGHQNVGAMLVEAGYARVQRGPNAERSIGFSEYRRAEETALASALNIWSLGAEEVDRQIPLRGAPKRTAEVDTSVKLTPVSIGEAGSVVRGVPTHVGLSGDAIVVYLQASDASESIVAIQDRLQSEKLAELTANPRTNDLVVAKFSADKCWYRARVTGPASEGAYPVRFADYGNDEHVPRSQLRALPADMSSIPESATEYRLAFVRPAPENCPDAVADCLACVQSSLPDLIAAKVEYRDSNRKSYITLGMEDPSAKGRTLNSYLVRQGLARSHPAAESVPTFTATMKALQADEESAKRDRLNMWQFGDVEDDEEY